MFGGNNFHNIMCMIALTKLKVTAGFRIVVFSDQNSEAATISKHRPCNHFTSCVYTVFPHAKYVLPGSPACLFCTMLKSWEEPENDTKLTVNFEDQSNAGDLLPEPEHQ